MRAGVDAELDELRGLSQNGRQMIAAIEERERTRTGITSLKVRFNSVFGYYIEVTKANTKAVPADYERKQTLANAERFTTPELKDLETKILTAQERSVEIERRIFAELRRQLLDVAALYAEFCGWLHQEAGDLRRGMEWTERALQQAHAFLERERWHNGLGDKDVVAPGPARPFLGGQEHRRLVQTADKLCQERFPARSKGSVLLQ